MRCGNDYYVDGVISTTVNGVSTRLTGYPLQFTLPLNTLPPVIYPTSVYGFENPAFDPRGWTFAAREVACGDCEGIRRPLFPDLGVWQCYFQCHAYGNPLSEQNTALYLTHTTTSTETDQPSPEDPGKLITSPRFKFKRSSPTIVVTFQVFTRLLKC